MYPYSYLTIQQYTCPLQIMITTSLPNYQLPYPIQSPQYLTTGLPHSTTQLALSPGLGPCRVHHLKTSSLPVLYTLSPSH